MPFAKTKVIFNLSLNVRNLLSVSICLENARQLAHASIWNTHDAAHLHKKTNYLSFSKSFLELPMKN